MPTLGGFPLGLVVGAPMPVPVPEEAWRDVRLLVPMPGVCSFPAEAPGRMHVGAYDATTGAFVVIDAPGSIGSPGNLFARLTQFRPLNLHPVTPPWCNAMAAGYRLMIPATMWYHAVMAPIPGGRGTPPVGDPPPSSEERRE